MLCEVCNKLPSKPQICPGDGSNHHHGGVHIKGGGCKNVCDNCFEEIEAEWKQPRNLKYRPPKYLAMPPVFEITDEMVNDIATTALDSDGAVFAFGWATSLDFVLDTVKRNGPNDYEIVGTGEKFQHVCEAIAAGVPLILTLDGEEIDGYKRVAIDAGMVRDGIRRAAEIQGKSIKAFIEDCPDHPQASLVIECALWGKQVFA